MGKSNYNKANNNGKTGRSTNKGRGRSNYSGKKTEFSVNDADINAADLRGVKAGPNDISWYAKNAALLRDSASLVFSHPLGINNRINIEGGSTPGFTWNQNPAPPFQSINGIMLMNYIPTIGEATSSNAAANVAARALYSYVRHANSGSRNYDSTDLMLYVLAMDSCYVWYSTLCRIYGILRRYSMLNRYTPKTIVTTLGFDYDNLVANMADFRYFINYFASKLGSTAVPAQFDIVNRHIWLQSNIFTDSENTKAQMYVWDAQIYYVYNETEAKMSGHLVAYQAPNYDNGLTGTNLIKLSDIIKFTNLMLDPILGSEDMGIMSGDILKAFGAGNLFKISMIAEDYSIVPTYSKELLMQVENAYFYNPAMNAVKDDSGFSTVSEWNVTQQLNNFETGPYLSQNIVSKAASSTMGGQAMAMMSHTKVLNLHFDDPTPADVMHATRMSTYWNLDPTSEAGVVRLRATTYGTEIPTTYTYVGNMYNDNGQLIGVNSGRLQSTVVMEYSSGTYPAAYYDLISAFECSQFDWCPIMYNIRGEYSAVNTSYTKCRMDSVFCDFDNYTFLTQADLEAMHETATLSEFAIPAMGFNA